MIGSLWRQHRLASAVFLLAGLAAVLFTVRLVVFWVYWADPAHRNAELEGWMTPGYVARSWDVPRDFVLETLGIASDGRFRDSLNAIAAERGVTAGELIEQLEPAIADWRARNP